MQKIPETKRFCQLSIGSGLLSAASSVARHRATLQHVVASTATAGAAARGITALSAARATVMLARRAACERRWTFRTAIDLAAPTIATPPLFLGLHERVRTDQDGILPYGF